MRYATVFFLGSAALAAMALRGTITPLLAWLSLDLAAVGAAYAGVGPRLFGKRADGTLAPVAVLFLAPYLILTWVVWHLSRLLRREAAFNRLVGGIIIGRRLLPGEVPSGVGTVVDLTAEFQEPRAVRTGRTYRTFPILDGTAPEPLALEGLVREVLRLPGDIYLHCAEGHGRTGLVAASLLLAGGHAATPDEAVAFLLRQRPRAHMNRAQRRSLDSLAVRLTGG
jgi:hypothetical protein